MDQILDNLKNIFEDVKTFFVNLVDDIGLTTAIIAGSAVLALLVFVIILLIVSKKAKKNKKVTSTKTAWENSKERVIESTRVMEGPLTNTSAFIVSGKMIKEEKVEESFDNAKFLQEVEQIRSVKPVKIAEKDLPMSEDFEQAKSVAKTKKPVAKKPAAKKATTKTSNTKNEEKQVAKKPATKTTTKKAASKTKTQKEIDQFAEYSETLKISQDEIMKKTAKFKKEIDERTARQLAEVDKILGRSQKEVKESEKSIKEFGKDLDNFMKEMDKIKKAGK